MSSDTHYGLPSVRDRDGKLKAVDYSFTYDGEEVTVKIRPPTAAEVDEYEQMQDPSATRLAEIVCKHIKKPAFDDPGEMSLPEIQCYSSGILNYAGGGMSVDVNEALDERAGGDSGN